MATKAARPEAEVAGAAAGATAHICATHTRPGAHGADSPQVPPSGTPVLVGVAVEVAVAVAVGVCVGIGHAGNWQLLQGSRDRRVPSGHWKTSSVQMASHDPPARETSARSKIASGIDAKTTVQPRLRGAYARNDRMRDGLLRKRRRRCGRRQDKTPNAKFSQAEGRAVVSRFRFAVADAR